MPGRSWTARSARHFFLAVDLPQSDAVFVKAYPAETAKAFCGGYVAALAFLG
jgi:hypothetical protein